MAPNENPPALLAVMLAPGAASPLSVPAGFGPTPVTAPCCSGGTRCAPAAPAAVPSLPAMLASPAEPVPALAPTAAAPAPAALLAPAADDAEVPKLNPSAGAELVPAAAELLLGAEEAPEGAAADPKAATAGAGVVAAAGPGAGSRAGDELGGRLRNGVESGSVSSSSSMPETCFQLRPTPLLSGGHGRRDGRGWGWRMSMCDNQALLVFATTSTVVCSDCTAF